MRVPDLRSFIEKVGGIVFFERMLDKIRLHAVGWLPSCLAALLATQFPAAGQNHFTDAEAEGVRVFLRDNFQRTNACMVIGTVDERGGRIFSAGTLANGTVRQPDGETIFFIGSISKTFTALLLQDAVERGEMKLTDPVATCLPASVKLPLGNGGQITLLDLATHGGGFPINPDNMAGRGVKEQYETYGVELMYAYLSGFTLTRDPGAEYEYSNFGMALLGHAIARKLETNFESLVVSRICRPLNMDSTFITVPAEQQQRLAMGRDRSGNPSPPWKFQAYSPVGSIHSTANDLLKYLSAQVGLKPSGLARSIEKTQVIRFKDSRGLAEVPGFGTFGRTAMDWADRGADQPAGMELLGHGGGAGSYHAWAGFDKKQRRGVVVLTTAAGISPEAIGWTLLQRRPLKSNSVREFAHEFFGLGFLIGLDEATQMLSVTKVYSNSPAARAGLKEGMLIQKVENGPTVGKSLTECQQMRRANGRPKVRMELIDPAGKTTNTVEVTKGNYMTAG